MQTCSAQGKSSNRRNLLSSEPSAARLDARAPSAMATAAPAGPVGAGHSFSRLPLRHAASLAAADTPFQMRAGEEPIAQREAEPETRSSPAAAPPSRRPLSRTASGHTFTRLALAGRTSAQPQIETAQRQVPAEQPVQREAAETAQHAVCNQPHRSFPPMGKEVLRSYWRPVQDLSGAHKDPTVQRVRITNHNDIDRDPLVAPTGQETQQLNAIKDALQQYNAVAGSRKEYQNRLHWLQELDTAIYAWFSSHPSPNLDDVPKSGLLRKILAESEREHEKIVAATKDRVDILPFKTDGMNAKEIQDVTALWQSLVAQTGNVAVEGDAVHNRKTYSQLAKLMRTPTGRQLLKYLNDPGKSINDADPKISDARVRIISSLAVPKNIREAEKATGRDSVSSYAIAPPAIGNEKFREHIMDAPSAIGDKDDLTNMDEVTNPDDLINAILANRRGITMGGNKMFFGKGSGVVVKMHDKSGLGDPNKMTGDTNDNEALDQGYITLGHELGHAMKIRAGALLQGSLAAESMLESMEPNDVERKLYGNNAEEFTNITGVENKIREESGLHKRAYHKPQATVINFRRKKLLEQKLKLHKSRDPICYEMPEFEAATARLNADTDNLHDNGTYDALDHMIDLLSSQPTDEEIIRFKRQGISERVTEMFERAQISKKDAAKYIVPTQSFRQFRQEINSSGDYALGVSLTPLRDKIFDYREDLPVLLTKAKQKKQSGVRKKIFTYF